MIGEHGTQTFDSPETLMAFAAEFAAGMAAGDVIALTGTLGAGKTHFTKGFVHGLGCSEPVSSPTFSLVQEYHGGRLPVFHFDLYRTKSAYEVLDLGWDDYTDREGICIAEWADLFPEIFPANTYWLEFTSPSPTQRTLSWKRGCR